MRKKINKRIAVSTGAKKGAGFEFVFSFICKAFIICFLSSGGARAQEPIAEVVNNRTTNATIPAFSLSVPLTESIDLNLTGGYGFGLRAKALIVEMPFKLNKYLTIAPSYLYLASPVMNRSYHENQVRLSATFTLPVGKATLDDRSMFERRFRTGFDDSTRYHNRLRIRYPLKIKNFDFSVVAFNEATYDGSLSRWDRNRISAGISKTFAKRLTTEVYYLRQINRQGGGANIVLISTIVRTDKLSKWFKKK